MKRLIFIILSISIVMIAGCSNDSSKDEQTKDNKEQTEDVNKDKENEDGNKKIYQIEETAQIISDLYDFPYEVTVNSFELSSKPVNGIGLEKFGYTAEEGGKFAVVNVTIKNTSDQAFVPNEMISAQLVSESIGLNSEDEDFFLERNKELKPDEEITGNLVYISSNFNKDKVLYLVYEYMAADEETRFELPVSQ